MSGFVSAFAGLGLFLFSLRVITTNLDEAVNQRLRPWLDRLTQKATPTVLLGTIASIGLVHSSTSIISTMGLLNRSLVSLDRAAHLMIGATIGTALKTWLHIPLYSELGGLCIGATSFAVIFLRKQISKRILEILLGVGISILGLQMVSQGLAPLLRSHWITDAMAFLTLGSFLHILLATGMGVILAVCVQSSSAIVLLVLSLADEFSLGVAACLILGANLGTTSTALFVSIEHSDDAKRLAFMHFIMKAVGVFFTVLFLGTFLSAVDVLIPGEWDSYKQAHLAGVHTLFSVINGVIWAFFVPILTKMSRMIIKEKVRFETGGLSPIVQRLLARIPDRAVVEAGSELQHIIPHLKEVYDRTYEWLEFGGRTDRPDGIIVQGKLATIRTQILQTKSLLERVLRATSESDAYHGEVSALVRKTLVLEEVARKISKIIQLVVEIQESEHPISEASLKRFNKLHQKIQARWEELFLEFMAREPESEERLSKLPSDEFMAIHQLSFHLNQIAQGLKLFDKGERRSTEVSTTELRIKIQDSGVFLNSADELTESLSDPTKSRSLNNSPGDAL